MKTIKIITRVLVSPFVLALFLITMFFEVMRMWVDFLRFGGEFINYEKDSQKRISDLYGIVDGYFSKQKQQ